MKQENMDDELKKNAPGLYEQAKKDDGFKVPEGYFDTLEDRVFGRIEAAGIRRESVLKVRKKPAKRFSLPQILLAAAAMLTLMFAAVWFFKPVTVPEQTLALVELSEEDIESYVLENVQDFEAEQLASLPEVEDLEEEQVAPEQKQTPTKSPDPLEDIAPEDVEHILNDMTDEELKEIL